MDEQTDGIEHLIAALHDADVAVRRRAVRGLTQHPADGAIDGLYLGLYDADPIVQTLAAQALAAREVDGIENLLLEQLDHANPSVQRAMLDGLGDRRSVRAVQPLAQRIDAGHDMARAMLIVLGRIGTDEALDVILRCRQHPDAGLRTESLYALAVSPHPRALPALLSDFPKVDIRAQLDLLLALIDEGSAAGAVDPLLALLPHGDPSIRSQAVWLLGHAGDSRAVMPLTAALDDTNAYMRRCVAEALGKLGDHRAVEPLKTTLVHETDDRAASAMRAALRLLGHDAGEASE